MNGQPQQLPAGDNINIGSGGFTTTGAIITTTLTVNGVPISRADFVRALDEEGVNTAAELDARIRTDLAEASERMLLGDYQDEIVDLLVATASLDYPEVLVDREIDRIIDRESNHASHTQEGLNNWLNAIGKSLDELREELKERADLTVRRALVIGQLIEAEAIERAIAVVVGR